MRAIGMGAEVTVVNLEELVQRFDVGMQIKVETKYGC